MTLTALAVVIGGIWLVVTGAEEALPSSTLTLIFGIVIVALVLIEALRGPILVGRRRD